jgi:alpha-tubulin suppressor-like RCC1 family protein
VNSTSIREVYYWGDGDGLADKTARISPEKVSGLDHQKIIQVACGFSHCLALTAKGRVFSFGENDSGELGHGDNKSLIVPKKIKSLPVKIKSISTKTFSSLALLKNGHVWVWGADPITQVGYDPDPELNIISPVRFFQLDATIESTASGTSFSGALSTDGELYLWGQSGDGTFGFGALHEFPSPRKVSVFAEKISQFCCGNSHVLALSESGKLYSWGGNDWGQLGLGWFSASILTPEQIWGGSLPGMLGLGTLT